MNDDVIEHLQHAEYKTQQLTAVATAVGEAAEQIDQTTLALCFQVIERLGRECQNHLAQVEAASNH
ncbi:hypothetical protein BS333_14135 [Vibrio azureus]|uniref:Uncharacterized protein n=1 Tax=Vibrio azureus NBRC 104587 TaxID=1219077 RepID=U3BZ05_9VIBR|nr:hypothetical protein [Vibrio azureus]AUI87554.1 hypothetical protein BS333_14135 [Vibrio azureus]GAD74524.1 hypothetical protein VAZ01S_012_00030 [Vibrio azureus NBRC 104587]